MVKAANQIKKQVRYGKGQRYCRRCNTHRGLIRAYNLYICRRCFREVADRVGFHKYH